MRSRRNGSTVFCTQQSSFEFDFVSVGWQGFYDRLREHDFELTDLSDSEDGAPPILVD